MKQSWNKGHFDGEPRMPSKCDELAYANGYIERKAQRAKRD